jgi:hypothetical protein
LAAALFEETLHLEISHLREVGIPGSYAEEGFGRH